jgi:hypothetical protein
MPSDLIVPAFVLTMAVNAILIALAIRTFAGERSRDRRPIEPPERAPEPAAATGPEQQPQPGVPAAVVTEPTPPSTADEAREAQPIPPPRPKRSPAKAAAAGTAAAAPAAKPVTKRRRRFSLPQDGEDHERFDRSIATFLSGGRGADPD